MAKWLIVQKSDLKILSIYESEESHLGTNKLGGPWNDADKVMHLQVPANLADRSMNELAIVHEPGVIAIEFVPCQCDQGKPIYREAYDKNGQLMVDKEGYPMYARLYEKNEITAMVYKVKLIGQ